MVIASGSGGLNGSNNSKAGGSSTNHASGNSSRDTKKASRRSKGALSPIFKKIRKMDKEKKLVFSSKRKFEGYHV